MHLNIRQYIYEEAILRINILPNIIIDSERGRFKISDYILTIKGPNNYGGDLEISLSYDLYNYNLAQYREIYDDFGNFINLEFVKYINNNNNENKDLLNLTNINDNHYNLAYYNIKQ